MIKLGGVVMILDLHRQGLSVSAIARESGLDRKTVRRYIERGLEPPRYGPRKPRPRLLDPFAGYLRERVTDWPGLTGARLLRELRERGYTGGYTAVTDYFREVRPTSERGYEVRFETAPGEEGQVDFAQFKVVLTDEPDTPREADSRFYVDVYRQQLPGAAIVEKAQHISQAKRAEIHVSR